MMVYENDELTNQIMRREKNTAPLVSSTIVLLIIWHSH